MLSSMLEREHIDPERVRPLRRSEYERMVELGLFEEERIELLRGSLVTMSPQGVRHALVLQRLTHALVGALGDRFWVRVQLPLAASEVSEPEPDVAVVPRGSSDHEHPTAALLVIEVAETSPRKDRDVKARIYAEMAVPEYWVVDLAHDEVLVYAEPDAGTYATVRTARADESLTPHALADVVIAVASLLP